jgi:hypothetical protein
MPQTTSVEIETALLERLRARRPGRTDRVLLESVVLSTLGRATLRSMRKRNSLTEDEAIALGVQAVQQARQAGVSRAQALLSRPDSPPATARGLFALQLASACQKVLEEGQGAASRRCDYLAAVGIDDRERPMLGHRLGEDRPEALLISCDEGGSLGVALRIGRGFDQPLVCDLAPRGQPAAP